MLIVYGYWVMLVFLTIFGAYFEWTVISSLVTAWASLGIRGRIIGLVTPVLIVLGLVWGWLAALGVIHLAML